MRSGRHGGRSSEYAGARDVAADAAETGWIAVRYGVYQGLVVGKTYVFDGRKGKVLEKRENSTQRNAAGWSTGLPMIRVEWKS